MRRRVVLVLLVIAITVPAVALEGAEAAYVGGTVSHLQQGAVGRLDLTSGTELVFLTPGLRLEIPYNRIESFQQSQQLAVHLGVAPTIAVVLVKHRMRNHFVRITYKDNAGEPQVVVFEIPKTMPMVLMPILMARAPQARCAPNFHCAPVPRSIPTPSKEAENNSAALTPSPIQK